MPEKVTQIPRKPNILLIRSGTSRSGTRKANTTKASPESICSQVQSRFVRKEIIPNNRTWCISLPAFFNSCFNTPP